MRDKLVLVCHRLWNYNLLKTALSWTASFCPPLKIASQQFFHTLKTVRMPTRKHAQMYILWVTAVRYDYKEIHSTAGALRVVFDAFETVVPPFSIRAEMNRPFAKHTIESVHNLRFNHHIRSG
jgi:hypothetical protein